MVYKEKSISLPFVSEIYTSEVRKLGKESFQKIISLESEILERKSIGYHLIAEFYEITEQIILEPQKFYNIALEITQQSQLSCIDSFLHVYPPHGLSIILVLKESHIGIHTWPEHNYVSIDVFICDEPNKAKKFVLELKNILQPEKVEIIEIDRGYSSTTQNS